MTQIKINNVHDQFKRKKASKANRIHNNRACRRRNFGKTVIGGSKAHGICGSGFLVKLPQIKFNPELVLNSRMPEIAKIFYSAADAKRQKPKGKGGPESISSILPRVMTGIVRLRQQRTN